MRMTIRSTRDGWTKVAKQHFVHESVKAQVIRLDEPGERGWLVMTPRKQWFFYPTMAIAMKVAAKTATYFSFDSRPDCGSLES